MGAKRIKVEAADVQPGMFVAALDRSWLATPFVVHGFEVRSNEDIDRLRKYCQHVFVDVGRSSLASNKIEKLSGDNLKPEKLTVAKAYKKGNSFRSEAPKARDAYIAAANILSSMQETTRAGGAFKLADLRAAALPIVDSVIRNPNAIAYYANLQKRVDYFYNHSLASAVWATIVGRHMNLDRDSLERLAMGGMLMDLGKARIPQKLLTKPEALESHEVAVMCKHVAFGMEIVGKTNGLGSDVLEMIAAHHEREDGSGYPQGLKGDQISLFARIAGLVDCFDAMISERPYAPARSGYEAMLELNQLSGTLFSKKVVEQFVQAIGMFPSGSIVELSSGEIAIVVEQNVAHRLQPTVTVVLDQARKSPKKLRTVDLCERTGLLRRKSRHIVRGYEYGSFGIDPRNYFI